MRLLASLLLGPDQLQRVTTLWDYYMSDHGWLQAMDGTWLATDHGWHMVGYKPDGTAPLQLTSSLTGRVAQLYLVWQTSLVAPALAACDWFTQLCTFPVQLMEPFWHGPAKGLAGT